MILHRSNLIDKYVYKSFLPTLFISITFFVLIIEIADLFANIVSYIQNEATMEMIFKSMILYVPKCMSTAFPIAILFSVSYTLGTMYSNNEIIVVLSSGISLISFMIPFVLSAIILGAAFFVFDDAVVIPTTIQKQIVTNQMRNVGEIEGSSDVTILVNNQKLLWNVKYFDYTNSSMTGIIIIERDEEGKFVSRLDAKYATWEDNRWKFSDVRLFHWKNDSLVDDVYTQWENKDYNEIPDSFKTKNQNIDELTLKEAKEYIKFLKRSHLPYYEQSAEYLQRYAFALTPLIVTLLSAVLVGKYKKNILLMSLLQSLIAATIYYVVQMITMLLAKNETISPFFGAFSPIFVFGAIIFVLLSTRKS